MKRLLAIAAFAALMPTLATADMQWSDETLPHANRLTETHFPRLVWGGLYAPEVIEHNYERLLACDKGFHGLITWMQDNRRNRRALPRDYMTLDHRHKVHFVENLRAWQHVNNFVSNGYLTRQQCDMLIKYRLDKPAENPIHLGD
ncbi:MAG: hypothetical protein Alpg2KO_30260 [Alphaproteobacteria bacterium]